MKYTDEMRQFIVDHYKGTPTYVLVNMFNEKFKTNVSLTAMKSYKSNHKLSSGLTGYFEKGHIPINKGTKGMFNVGGNRTSFKKGQLPTNTCQLGEERLLKDGYVWVKVNNIPKAKKNVNWKQKQKLIYEKAYGPVPEGYRVIFADGNIRNFDLNNLVLVSKAEVLYLNRHHMIYNDSNLTKSAVLVARMESKANELKRRYRHD